MFDLGPNICGVAEKAALFMSPLLDAKAAPLRPQKPAKRFRYLNARCWSGGKRGTINVKNSAVVLNAGH